MHRAIASYANGGAAPVLDDTTVLEQYGSLVERTARRLVSRTGLRSAYDDLWSAGAIGLIEAGRRFDPSRGASFATFAEHRVRGAMLDELRRLDHLPRRLRNRTDGVHESVECPRTQQGYKLSAAAMRSRTPCTEFSNIWRSVASSSMTTIFSTPWPPMTAGTPM